MRFFVISFALSVLILSFGIDVISAQTESPETSRPPTNPSPKDGAGSVAFPLTLEWEKIPGAESYFYNIFGMKEAFLVTKEVSGFLPEAMINALSQKPHPYEKYTEQCAETKGQECSEDSFWAA